MEEKLEQILTEQELAELFNAKKEQIDYLRRQEKLPFVAVSNRVRLYYEPDIMEWLLGRRKVLNLHE